VGLCATTPLVMPGLAGALTVREWVVEWVGGGLPVPVPVTVTEEVPDGVEDEVEMVMEDDPPAVTDVGLNVAVAPEGSPLADRLTVWAEPEVTAVDTVGDVELPAVTVPLEGLTAIEKSLPGGEPQPGRRKLPRR